MKKNSLQIYLLSAMGTLERESLDKSIDTPPPNIAVFGPARYERIRPGEIFLALVTN